MFSSILNIAELHVEYSKALHSPALVAKSVGLRSTQSWAHLDELVGAAHSSADIQHLDACEEDGQNIQLCGREFHLPYTARCQHARRTKGNQITLLVTSSPLDNISMDKYPFIWQVQTSAIGCHVIPLVLASAGWQAEPAICFRPKQWGMLLR